MTTRMSRRVLLLRGTGLVSMAGLLAACGPGAPGGSSGPAATAAVPPPVQPTTAATSAPAAPATAAAKPTSAQAVPPATTSANSAQAVALKVQVGTQNVEFAGMYEAEQQGYLKSENISQSLLPTGPNVAPVTVVSGGGADLGILGGADSLIKARSSGVPVKAFGVLLQKAPSGLLSLASNPIKTPKDAVGKKIGLQSGARGPWSTILQLNGLDEKQMTIVPVEFDPAPLVNGQVDGFWSYAFNQPLALQAQGLDTVMMVAYDAGYKFYGDVLFATDQVIKDQEDALVRWLRASAKGWEYTIAHPEESAQFTVNRSPELGLKVDQQIAQNKAQIDYVTSALTKQKGLLWMEPATWQVGIDILDKLGQLNGPVTVDDIQTTTLLEKAFGGKVSLLT
jgi:NitT/TauT family transport system substrate-binding protein